MTERETQLRDMRPRTRLLIGGSVSALGIFGMLVATGVIDPQDSSAGAPLWVGVIATSLFLVAGQIVMWHGTRFGTVLGFAGPVLIVLGLAAVADWIAFGPGPRQCTSSITGWFANSRNAGEIECRIAFGFGAMMMNAIVVVIAANTAARAFGPRRALTVIENAGWCLLIVVLLPLLLVALVLTLVSGGGSKVKRAFGRWRRRP